MARTKRLQVPPGLVSRTEAMKLLQRSRTAVRKLDDEGLAPRTIRGVVYYELQAVQDVLLGMNGGAAQLAFRCFEQGKGPVYAVAEHRLPPAEAGRLWKAYVQLKSCHSSTCIIELPKAITSEAWRRAHGYAVIDGNVVRAALELCARDPRLKRSISIECEQQGPADIDDMS